MQNTSGLKFFSAAAAVFFLCLTPAQRAYCLEDFGKAVIEKYEETSTPLFKTDEPDVKEKLKGDPFFDKMRKKNREFTKEEQERRRNFIEKVRGKNWEGEKLQEKLTSFQKKEAARRKKFIDKQQKKIQKHQEEES